MSSLETVLQQLADAFLTLNLAKCEFGKATVTMVSGLARGRSGQWMLRWLRLFRCQCPAPGVNLGVS